MIQGINRGSKRPPRILCYGPPKIGKSTFGAGAPGCVFVPTEDGVNEIDVPQFGRAESWDQLLANLATLADEKEKHEYKAAVLDTLNGAVELAAQHVCTKLFNGDWGPKGYNGYGAGVAATSEEMRKLIIALEAIRNRGLWIVLLAHTGVQTVRNPLQGEFSKYTPDIPAKVWSRFHGWCDVIVRADFEYAVLPRPGAPASAMGKATASTTRVLFAAGSAAEDAGTRVGFELPEKLPLSWGAFSSALGKDRQAVTEIKQHWNVLTAEEQKAVLTWLGIPDLDAINATPITQLRELLNRLRQLASERTPAAAEEDKGNG